MGEWSDEEPTASEPTQSNSNGIEGRNSFIRGRGRGRGRGSSFGDRGNRENENSEGNENRGYENRRGRGGYNSGNRDNSDQPKDGEWNCSECNSKNFSRRTECFRCKVAKPDDGTGNNENGSANRGNRDNSDQLKDGEWNCSECNSKNFSRRTECFRCKVAKPDDGTGNNENGSANRGNRDNSDQLKDGEWNCSECNSKNFARRTECFRCKVAKPDDGTGNNENGDGDNKKREIYVPEEPTDAETLFGSSISAGINFDNFDKIEVHVTGKGSEVIKEVNTFEEGNLREFLIENIKKSGYTKPTPIQKYSIPIITAKRDLMACAQTGSGKSASFILPILNVLMSENNTMNSGKPQCLIVAPTRELAIQIRDEAMKFASGSFVKVCLAYGGAASRYQTENITQGCHILVATPGRLIDFVNKSVVSFEDLKFLVMDEADRMLDMGFREIIETIFNHETMNKENLTTLMFSATFPDTIQLLAAKFLRDYLFLTIGIVGGASTDVEQEFIEVERKGKRQLLTDILKTYTECAEEDRILVFVETKKTADYLASLLSETSLSTTSIHGDRTQKERETALREFRQGVRKVLIATAVAARGLDIKGVTHVINYDLPKEVDEYIHRIGRTGRVGNRGKATSFYDQSQDNEVVSELTRILKQANQIVPEFFSGGSGACGGVDQFGGADIRQPATAATEESEW